MDCGTGSQVNEALPPSWARIAFVLERVSALGPGQNDVIAVLDQCDYVAELLAVNRDIDERLDLTYEAARQLLDLSSQVLEQLRILGGSIRAVGTLAGIAESVLDELHSAGGSEGCDTST